MLKHGFYNIVGAGIRLALAVITVPFLIRLVGVEEYGLWTLVSAAVGLVAIAEAGLSVSTTVFVSRDLATNDQEALSQTLTITITAMLLLATFAALVLWLGAPYFVRLFPSLHMLQQQAAIHSLQLGGIVVWARLLQQIPVSVEQAYHRYGSMNVLNTAQVILVNAGTITVAWLGGRSVALMKLQAIVAVAILLAHCWFNVMLLRQLKLRPSWNNHRLRAITRYSGLTWFSSLGSALFTQCDRLIVGSLLGTSILGMYSAITNITVQINTFSALPVQPLLPTISSMIAKPTIDYWTLRKQIRRSFLINATVALGMGALLFTFAPIVINVLIPENISSELINSFRIATVIYSIYSLNAVGYYILFALEKLRVSILVNLSSGVCSLILITILSNKFGLVGAVSGNVGYILSLLFVIFALKYLQSNFTSIKGNPNAVSY